jgi:hypothetical protein
MEAAGGILFGNLENACRFADGQRRAKKGL